MFVIGFRYCIYRQNNVPRLILFQAPKGNMDYNHGLRRFNEKHRFIKGNSFTINIIFKKGDKIRIFLLVCEICVFLSPVSSASKNM